MDESRNEYFMREAIAEACKAGALGEVPVGAVVVKEGKILARSYNLKETAKDPTAHAEMLAIRETARVLGGWRLLGTVLYVTLEPCAMCAGALVQARVPRVVFGAPDPKGGAAGSVVNLLNCERFNHQVEVTGGVLVSECEKLMKDFFKDKR